MRQLFDEHDEHDDEHNLDDDYVPTGRRLLHEQQSML